MDRRRSQRCYRPRHWQTAAQLHAMQTLSDTSDHAPMSDELHCWYRDAHETAATAANAVRTVAAQPQPFGIPMQGIIDIGKTTTGEENTRCALGTKRVVPSVLELFNQG